ncbi:hypothetical protein INT48_006202 [Thamnidium elegans]|uniref:Uncharacterized protein n=1 Tax=Thamnidium elegans TaxID=101142 RepID=A0A8H7STJ4_9FUNG|nr:hypothetical protein INT48_006202 [Thamnidium elegans]
MDKSYKLKNKTNNPYFKYFSDHPISKWSFAESEASFNKYKLYPANDAKIKNTYLSIVDSVQSSSDVPDFARIKARRFSSSLKSPETETQNISYSITSFDSSVINPFNDLGTDTINVKEPQPTGTTIHQEEEEEEEEGKYGPTLNLIDPYDEESDEEDKIPSDLSLYHHPHRTYGLEWKLDSISVSDLHLDLKNTTLEIAKRTNPSQLSDIRLLILNDIYKIDRNFAFSVSKYFSSGIHTLLRQTSSFDAYLPTEELKCYSCQLLPKACASKDILDMHTAQVLTQILPVLINGPPDDSNEDSYVHYYLSPLLSSVFASDPLMKMKWANGQLFKNGNNEFKPDFLVYNLSGSIRFIILIVEFKPTEQNAYVESDLVKLAKQMKETLNNLVIKGVTNPKVCGIHCEGESVLTYVMDLPSPKYTG